MVAPGFDDFGYVVSPIIGMQFKSDLVEGLFIDLGYKYRSINPEFLQSRTMHTINFGLRYYFNFMKKKKEE